MLETLQGDLAGFHLGGGGGGGGGGVEASPKN